MQFVYEQKGSAIYVDYRTHLAATKHLHDHVELVLMQKGTVRATADDYEEYLHADEAFIAFPNQVHSFTDLGKEESIIIIFPPEAVPEYSKILRTYIPEKPILKFHTELLNPLAQLLLNRFKNNDPIRTGMVRGCLLLILGSLFETMNFKKIETTDISSLKSILMYCGQNYGREITLNDVAESLHISKYYISHIFSEKIKTSFPEYINNLRITEARRLLSNEEFNITEVSFAVGFSSIRSFNRNFLRQTGMSPKQYRASLSLK